MLSPLLSRLARRAKLFLSLLVCCCILCSTLAFNWIARHDTDLTRVLNKCFFGPLQKNSFVKANVRRHYRKSFKKNTARIGRCNLILLFESFYYESFLFPAYRHRLVTHDDVCLGYGFHQYLRARQRENGRRGQLGQAPSRRFLELAASCDLSPTQ